MSAAKVSVLLRLPEDLKKKVDAAAAEAEVSVNQWLLGAAQDQLEQPGPGGTPSREAIVASLKFIASAGDKLAAGWTLVPPTTEQNGH